MRVATAIGVVTLLLAADLGGGWLYDEVGDALGVPAKTVKSRLHTARQRLGELLLGGRPLGAQAALLGVLAVSVGFDPALLETPPPARPRECGDNNDGDNDDDDDPCSGGHLFPFELGFDQVSRALLRKSPNSGAGRMIAPA